MKEKDFTNYYAFLRKMYKKCVDYLVDLLKDREDHTYELNEPFILSIDYEGLLSVDKIILNDVNDLQLVGTHDIVRDAYEVFTNDLIDLANQIFEELN